MRSAFGIKARINDIEICYETFGDPRDPAVLLIAGFGEQMVSWESQFCNRLAINGYWVIRFDNRDFGRSTYLRDEAPSRLAISSSFLLGTGVRTSYTFATLANDAIALLDYLSVERAHVVGRCFGGMIAQTMAIQQPQRLQSLALLMSSSGDQTLKGPSFSLLAKIFRTSPSGEEAFVEHYCDTRALLWGKRYPYDASAAIDHARMAYQRGFNEDGLSRQLATCLSAQSRLEALSELRLPTLVIHGDDDPLIPAEHGIQTAQAIPTANLRIIPGLGHTLPSAYWPDLIKDLVNHFSS